MQDWLGELGLNEFWPLSRIEINPEFALFLEYLHQQDLVTPFFKIDFPVRHKFHVSVNNSKKLSNFIQFQSWEAIDEERLITFLPKGDEDLPWKIYPERIPDPDNEDFTISLETRYYYHPIQFLQLLTILHYLRNSLTPLHHLSSFVSYYEGRIKELNSTKILPNGFGGERKPRSVPRYPPSLKSTPDEYIKIPKSIKWLTIENFQLWLKLESVYNSPLFSPGNTPGIFLRSDLRQDDEIQQAYEEEHKRHLVIFSDLKSWFKDDDFKQLEQFHTTFTYDLNSTFQGLDNWFDLLTQISTEKKDRVKGYLSYYLNMFSVAQTIEMALYDLAPTPEQKKDYKLNYYLDDREESVQFRQRLLYQCGLLAEDIFIIYVEGDTEFIVLSAWFSAFRFSKNLDGFAIKNIGGREKTGTTFEYTLNNFTEKEHFLLLDTETPQKKTEKERKLTKRNIPTESYHFFEPDFVTVNFSIPDFLRGYKNWMDEIKCNVPVDYLQDIESKLTSEKNSGRSIEKALENLHNQMESFPSYSKPAVAKKLSPILIAQSKRGITPHFETALAIFYQRINETQEKSYHYSNRRKMG